MQELNFIELSQHILALQQIRDSKVLVIAASHLELDLLPNLYEHCKDLGHCPRLDIVLHGRGGVVNAARRIALLLRQNTEHLTFIVPYHCQSSATLLTLCADEIIAGELALFSPIDPQLEGENGSAFSGLDIQLFGEMVQQWFGVAADEARNQSLGMLCNSVFPPSLTAFYRTTLEIKKIAEELLVYQLPQAQPEARQKIVRHLMSGYHSHNYALCRDEMTSLGLNVRRDTKTEQVAWKISKQIQTTIGGNLRTDENAPWLDVLLASSDSVSIRQKQVGQLAPRWVSERVIS